MKELIRTARFQPFRKGMGPSFNLRMFDTGKTDNMGKSILAYELRITRNGKSELLFEGSDFHCSPMHGIDSDATVASLMGFLTLRPGDTDSDYFENYTEAQQDYCSQYAEALSCEVTARYGEL